MERSDKTHVKVAVGARIKAARTERGWTQKQLADLVGRQQPIIGRWESGENACPDEWLEKVAEVLAKPVEWFTAPTVQEDAYNPMLESAKQVLRMHGYEAVPAEEYHVWAKVRKLYAPGPGANTVKSAKVLRNFESGSHAFQPAHIPPTFTPDRNAGHRSGVIAEASEINWGPLLAVGFGSEDAHTCPSQGGPDDDQGGRLALVAR